MQAWIRIGQPLEPVISDYKRIFDAWEDAGVCGFVFGRTLFLDSQGQFTIPAFASNQQIYRNHGLVPNDRQAQTQWTKLYQRKVGCKKSCYGILSILLVIHPLRPNL